jgi:peptide/nickel transport system substrate-binding protein
MRAGLAALRRARKRSGRRGSAALSAFSAAACLAALLAACGPVTSAVSGGAPAPAHSGNTVTYALRPGGQASYIWPYISSDNGAAFTVYNVNDFQYLMYRPLYWFGQRTSPYLNPELSLAKPPTYNGSEVKIQLKQNYKWSNGDPVVARDVVFFMNMMLAEAHTASAAYNCNGITRPCKFWAATTGNGLPGDISDVRVESKYVVTMHINTPKFSHAWFTNNELSQITPMPLTWDQTASGPGHCATSISACDAVYDYLNSKAHVVSSYGSSPLWQVVDGPWRVKSLDSSTGKLTMTFNNAYSGPVSKNHITTLVEMPYTTEQAEYNVLQDPTANQTIDVGYLPTVDAPVPPAGALVGPNPRSLTNYTLGVLYPWELSYATYNYNNNTGQGAILKQLYFRDAFQRLVDQEGVINGPLHGYGKPNFGPVGAYPVTTYLWPALAKKGDPWTLNIPYAKKELELHGWQPPNSGNGPDTCQRPGSGAGQCGAGVRAGMPLTFTLAYASGVDWMESAARELVSNAALAGIQITLQPDTFSNVVGEVFTPSGKNYRKWQLAQWGSWGYSPDYLPTGDTLFEPSSPNDGGGYNDPGNNALITDTLKASTTKQFNAAMYAWQQYLAPRLPVIYEPNYPTLLETINGLSIGPQNSALTITPEMWYYRK